MARLIAKVQKTAPHSVNRRVVAQVDSDQEGHERGSMKGKIPRSGNKPEPFT